MVEGQPGSLQISLVKRSKNKGLQAFHVKV